jgi:hypothetical protein
VEFIDTILQAPWDLLHRKNLDVDVL